MIVVAYGRAPASTGASGPFLVVGALGLTWLLLWLPSVRSSDLQLPPPAAGPSLLSVLGWLVPLAVLFFSVRWLTMEADWSWLPGVPGDLFTAARGFVVENGWVPLTVQGLVTVVGIAAVYRWLRRSTQDEDRLPRGLFLYNGFTGVRGGDGGNS